MNRLTLTFNTEADAREAATFVQNSKITNGNPMRMVQGAVLDIWTEIHPLDLAELVEQCNPAKEVYEKRGDGLYALGDKLYHQNPNVARTPGPHSLV